MNGKQLLKEFLKEKDNEKGKRIFTYSNVFNFFQNENKSLMEEMMQWAFNKNYKDIESAGGEGE